MNKLDLKLIVGLGNPGLKYNKTRHNIGFSLIDEIASIKSLKFNYSKKIIGRFCEYYDGQLKIVLLKPDTYMNESGISVKNALKWLNINIQNILVVVDDMDLPLGKTRIRMKGGAGGHKGLKSIISNLDTEEFCRLRIGIGAPSLDPEERRFKTNKYVLSKFSKDENIIVKDTLKELAIHCNEINNIGIEKITLKINTLKGIF